MKKHWVMIVLAVFVALISSVPQYAVTKHVPNFQAIYRNPANDGMYYEARVKDVIDGHTFLSNPYIYEHKSGPPMQVFLPDFVMAKVIQLMHVSVPIGFIIWTPILEFILVLLSYAICFAITESRKWSFFGTLLLHLGFFAGTFLRLPSPGFNFVFWLSTLLFFILFIKTGKNKHAVLSAISLGILFNAYPYFWTFFVVLFGVFLVLMLILRKDFEYKKWILILIGAFAVGLPYIVSTWKSAQMSDYAETLARVGMIQSHFPSGIDSVGYAFILTILFLIFYFIKSKKINSTKDTLTIFLFSGVLSTAIVVNQHIITGKNLEFSSHYFLGNTFMFFFAVLFLLYVFFQKQKTIFVVAAILICLFAVVKTNALIHIETTYSADALYVQNYAPVFNWLNANVKGDDVVYANDDLNDYIPVYTAQNVYSSAGGILFFMSDAEAEKRFIINHYFDNFTADYVFAHQRAIYGAFYIDQYNHNQSKNKLRKLFGLSPVNYVYIPFPVIQSTINNAKEIQRQSFETVIKNYKVDYVVWDKNKNPDWKLNKFKQVFASNGFYIFSVGE